VKIHELANEMVRFSGPLTFCNELAIKCVVGFGGFIKISKDPWQLMVEIDHFEISRIIRFFIIGN
jgi:hypothetical protein